MKLSQWHSGNVFPTRSGIYERKIFECGAQTEVYFCYFSAENQHWYVWGEDKEDALREFRNRRISDRLVKWRGLAEKPRSRK